MNYTLIYGKRNDGKIFLIRKLRPAWQKGKLNLPGGKVEDGESFIDAAVREWREETGRSSVLLECGIITDLLQTFQIRVFRETRCTGIGPRQKGEDEEIVLLSPKLSILCKDLIENLKIIIPFMEVDLRDWVISCKEGFPYAVYFNSNKSQFCRNSSCSCD